MKLWEYKLTVAIDGATQTLTDDELIRVGEAIDADPIIQAARGHMIRRVSEIIPAAWNPTIKES